MNTLSRERKYLLMIGLPCTLLGMFLIVDSFQGGLGLILWHFGAVASRKFGASENNS